jgi:DNA-binding MarR family transcriptional regulator
MSDAKPDRRLTAWTALLQGHASVVQGVEDDLMADLGLPLSWHEVLVRVERVGEHGMRMQDLARSVLLSKSGLTRLVDRMEQAALVERRACPSDRRGTYVAMTERGRDMLRRASPVFFAAVEQHLAAHLSPDDLHRLIGTLQAVARANGRPLDDDSSPDDEPAPTHIGPAAVDLVPDEARPAR